MFIYLIQRTIQSIIVLFFLSVILFALIHFMPGDPLTQFKQDNPGISQEEIERFIKLKGLDKPYTIQYYKLISNLVSGDFGRSSQYQVEISTLIPRRIVTTIKLTLPVFLLSLLIAIPLGVFTALYQYSKFDYSVNLLIFIGISAPTFWLGLISIYFFSVEWNIYPASGIETINVSSWLDEAKHFIIPIFVLSIHRIGTLVRFIRGSILEIVHLDYVRTARAKGLSEDQVIWKHIVRNALIPLLTLVALSIPHLISGALITEQIFGIPGMGQLMLTAIVEKDKEVALTAFLLLAILTLTFNLIADILYRLVDPRIKRA